MRFQTIIENDILASIINWWIVSDAIEGCDNNYINERIVSIGMSDCKSFIYFCTYIMYMFYLVGLGLFDEKDISLKGLECLRNVDKIYAEFFTSWLFGSSFEAIEELIGQKIEILVRGEVEEEKFSLVKVRKMY